MKKLTIVRLVPMLLGVALVGGVVAYAATSPSLESASTYAILSSTYTNTVPGTTVTGDIGFTTGPAVAPGGVHTNYGSGAPYATAGTNQSSALSSLASQVCTFTFAPGAIDLATDTTHGPIGVYTPGVYCVSGAASVGTAGITLTGSGTYIFRMTGALTTVANSVVRTSGASACDVWWTPGEATTLGANSTFFGNNIDASGITLGNNVSWIGRALAFGGTVTTAIDDTITAPTCSAPPPAAQSAALTLVKTVVNNNGGTKAVSDFPLSVGGTVVASGVATTFTPGSYTVSETNSSGYTAGSWGGDCSATGTVTLANGNNKTCTITNDDVIPVVPVVVATTTATLHVIKVVINDDGRTAVASSATIHVRRGAADVSGSPQAGTGVPGTSYTLSPGTYTVSENAFAGYSASVSGDCAGSGTVTLASGDSKTCIVVNNDVAVAAPKLPNTGIGPAGVATPWNAIIPVGILAALFLLYTVRKNQKS